MFFICTRDRPQTLGLCIESLRQCLRQALPGRTAQCYILDDSTTLELSAEVHRIATTAGSTELKLKVIGAARQHVIHQQLAALPREFFRLLKSTCRTLGQGPWDLAGVRNFAFLLAYCYSSDDDLVVFLDDDILLTSSVYAGHFITIDGTSLLRQLISSTPARQLVASGTAYFGRFDGSVLDHLRLALDDAERSSLPGMFDPESRAEARERLRQLSLFPSTLPIQLTLPGARTLNDGPGISGALLATTPASLLSHFLPSCYNEDWIWLALLGRSGAAIRRAGSEALHAAPPQAPISNDLIAYQNTGEVVYRAVREVMEEARSGTCALEWCEHQISAVHFLSAKHSLIGDISYLLKARGTIERQLRGCLRSATANMRGCVKDALDRVESMDHAALCRWFRRYLRQVPSWRGLLQEAREIVVRGRQSVKVLDEHQV